MTVIHFFKDISENSLPYIFIKEMMDGDGTNISSHLLLASAQTNQTLFPAERCHAISSGKWITSRSHKRFKKIIRELNPDIIHIHSAWGRTPWLIFKWAKKARIPVVLSPHKDFMEWNFRHHYITSKLPHFILMQRKMLQRASAVHAMTKQEYEVLQTLSWRPSESSTTAYNDKLALVIGAHEIDGVADTDRVGYEMSKLYRKVVDSNPFLLMNESCRLVENRLLALGVALNENADSDDIFIDMEDLSELLDKLTDEDWRLLQLHAYDQGILPFVEKAVGILHKGRQVLDITSVERFDQHIETAFLETAHPQIKVSRMKQLASDYKHNPVELKICTMLLNTKHLIGKRKISRRNLADLYAAFRFCEYNEYTLENMLEEIGMLGFASRMVYILHIAMGLEEGYVPFEMTNDSKTKKLIKQFFKSNMQ